MNQAELIEDFNTSSDYEQLLKDHTTAQHAGTHFTHFTHTLLALLVTKYK